ncbi:hypothetical protein LTR36_008062 [Oleoguttula mirabilis]|uniref:Uncharacterized protein n=1 Tax=Oleoguttula mirabilis TaxID=1507867 RepID=A0AAV9J899_9PEZI|nr:hypothetical protein LTR36_008062 [Oleoguttula mirabilis]
MDFWSRLIGGTQGPKKTSPKITANDPRTRLARFERVFNDVLDLCNRPRKLQNEPQQLKQLKTRLDRLAVLLREETRAPVPHTCLQYAASSQIYTAVGRAAIVSQDEAIVHSAVAVYAALIDSEEEDFLANASFASSVMRMITRVIDSGNVLVGVDTETAILEVLFTISAKIRLQPEILSVWFRSTAKPGLEDVFAREKKSFVGITQKDDFPLCYLLIDRVHHEGRIGDFARTGLLYIFEATGRSLDLEEWVVSSDLPTLMASGLGALYSQLSRELSILHPDATLPAVLAMSDYSTTHSRATAESAFSEKHKGHMATFLSYLAFWQDVLDHCRSADVKQTLLDHFQILFLQQLLYPSLLQSSDTDAGSSVAVLTYLTAMLESLDYPDLIHMMLTYLLAIKDDHLAIPSTPTTPIRPSMPPRSPTALKRRQSLMLMTAPKDRDTAIEPTVFNLVDLVLNSLGSKNNQTAYAALKLVATLMARQKKFAFGTLLQVQRTKMTAPSRTVGALETELDKYMELAVEIHGGLAFDDAYTSLTSDVRYTIEAQVPFKAPALGDHVNDDVGASTYILPAGDSLLRTSIARLRTFFTNSVEVNLALTQAIVSIASCIEFGLDTWLALDPSSYTFLDDSSRTQKPWQAHLDEQDNDAWSALQQASRRPVWSEDHAPLLYTALRALAYELEAVHVTVPNLGQLLAGRQNMLQATSIDASSSESPIPTDSKMQVSLLSVPNASRGHTRSSSRSSQASGPSKATNNAPSSPAPLSRGLAASPAPMRPSDINTDGSPFTRSIYQPPPPETPSTTDVLMQKITFPAVEGHTGHVTDGSQPAQRTASLNHVLTNIVILQEFALELVAVLQIRAAVLGEQEVRFS